MEWDNMWGSHIMNDVLWSAAIYGTRQFCFVYIPLISIIYKFSSDDVMQICVISFNNSLLQEHYISFKPGFQCICINTSIYQINKYWHVMSSISSDDKDPIFSSSFFIILAGKRDMKRDIEHWRTKYTSIVLEAGLIDDNVISDIKWKLHGCVRVESLSDGLPCNVKTESVNCNEPLWWLMGFARFFLNNIDPISPQTLSKHNNRMDGLHCAHDELGDYIWSMANWKYIGYCAINKRFCTLITQDFHT
jgi:hypothetical protein